MPQREDAGGVRDPLRMAAAGTTGGPAERVPVSHRARGPAGISRPPHAAGHRSAERPVRSPTPAAWCFARAWCCRPCTWAPTRQRGPAIVESLGFQPGTYIVGMDFPTRLWNSHYLPEEVFAIRLAAELRILIGQGYKYIFVANGHGATNQIETIKRLCTELSNTTPARLATRLTFAQRTFDDNTAGHANLVETANLMHQNRNAVDVGTLPPATFPCTPWSSPLSTGSASRRSIIVTTWSATTRDATAESGRTLFQEVVDETLVYVKKLME